MLSNPLKDLAIARPCPKLFFERFGIDAHEIQETLIRGTSIIIFTMFAGE